MEDITGSDGTEKSNCVRRKSIYRITDERGGPNI